MRCEADADCRAGPPEARGKVANERADKIVAIGASAGGVEAIRYLASQFPEGFGAAVMVVLHLPPNARSVLPDILNRAGSLHAVHAGKSQPLENGRIYIAPAGSQMLVHGGSVSAAPAAPEHGHLPGIDPLFRSVAEDFGANATGVVLTGNLDDGTAGIVAIKAAGGTVIVQDPLEARYPGMPTSALTGTKPDYVLRLAAIMPVLIRLTS